MLFLPVVVAAMLAVSEGRVPAPVADQGDQKKIVLVSAEGCLDGRTLKMARPATIEEAELIVQPVYRLSGSDAIKSQIKSLNGHTVRVRGELQGVPGGAPSTMIGGVRVGIGTGPDDPVAPTVTRTPSTPEIEVETITVLADTCNALRESARTAGAPAAAPAAAAPAVAAPATAPATTTHSTAPPPTSPARTAASPVSTPVPGSIPPPMQSGHYLFAWTGDFAKKGNDFLVVIDADPGSVSYGHLVTSVGTDQPTTNAHHTEYTMPASGMLFANDHYSGRTVIFDVRNATHPKVAASLTDAGGYMHPHSYLRLPNGHVLATFQHAHHETTTNELGRTGGLVELDDSGGVVRSASSADPAFSNALLTPYSLVVLPEIDRIVSTNSSMHDGEIFSGTTYQVWRLSDLKLLHTAYFDVGRNQYAHISPEEPRLAPDGSILVQTLGCGLERITGVNTDEPRSQLVHTFPGNWCGVPTIVGHYLVQSVPATHGLIVLDITNAGEPVEVARLPLGQTFEPHWTGWDAKTSRLVVTGSEPRLFLLKLDAQTGALSIDETFHDPDGRPGISFDTRTWPHGWTGSGLPHGVVFSR
jgi:hypothetical protein